jgi:hypothetical protein
MANVDNPLFIIPGTGVGSVRLGMWPCRVRAKWGRPLDWESWGDGNLNDALIYPGMCLRFSRCGSSGPQMLSRLVVIEIRRSDAVLFGRSLEEWNEEELVAYLNVMGFDRKLYQPDCWKTAFPHLTIWFESGLVSGIEI